MSTDDNGIEVEGLVREFKKGPRAVDGIEFRVAPGEIYGFLGPNGAGKTTTIKTLLGLLYPTAGEAYVLGAPAGDITTKHKIAYLPESPYFYEHMTAREVVRFYARLFGLKKEDAARRADELLDLVGLQADSRKNLRQFSKGMLQRVGIAQSLINDPQLLFYDEPTSGLDPMAHRDIRDLILQLKAQGKTIFLSSHQLSDVELICDRVSIIHRGILRKVGRVEDLIAGGQVEIVVSGLRNGLAEKLKAVAPGAEFAGDRAVLVQPPKRRTLEDIFVETVTDRIGKPAADPAMTGTNGTTSGNGAATGAAPVAPSASVEADTVNATRKKDNR